jgi:ribonuclease VapC
MKAVLDASALLAFLLDEPGQERVDAVLSEAVMSGVNWSEVVQQLAKRDADVSGCRGDLESLGFSIIPFDAEAAEHTAQLWHSSRPYGLSLGDRACIALGLSLKIPILTGDHLWAKAYPNALIQLIR